MANEAKVTLGAWSSTIITGTTLATAGFTSASNAVSTYLTTGSEASYPLLDFKCAVTSTTVTENGTIDVYRVPSDGTDDSPTPAGSFTPHYVGSFVLDNAGAAADYYLYGVPNVSVNDKFIAQNNDGTNALSFTITMRGRTSAPVV